MEPETRYYIQEQAPAGNYFNCVGLDIKDTRERAQKMLTEWKVSYPDRNYRLVMEVVVPL